MKIHLLALAAAAAMLVVGGSNALADPPGTCNNAVLSTDSGSITVTGICSVAAGTNITIDGNLTVSDGAVFNGLFSPGSIHVTGNVKVSQGALLGLGYGRKTAVVDGNIVANRPLSLYLGGVTVHGNVISNGGGTADRFYNFPIKGNTIDGNLIIHGWAGGWWGAVANTVGGNVDVSNNASVVHATDDAGCKTSGTFPNGCAATAGADDDSSEVQARKFTTPAGPATPQNISGNLICHGNTPPAHINSLDDAGGPNTVDGNKIGECAGL
jgi:hypothetical protein